MSPDGYAVSSASWENNAHAVNIYTQSGYPEGMATGDSGPPNGGASGTFGLAVDSTYIYAAAGNGDISRLDRATWLTPGMDHVYDSGSNTGVSPLTVDPGGNPLLGETLCDDNLFVSDSNGALTSTGLSPNTTEIKEVPTSLSGVTTTWASPGASVLTCDREGDIWALLENTAGTADELQRFTDTGALVSSFTLPPSVIAQGVAASPRSDELLVADNGRTRTSSGSTTPEPKLVRSASRVVTYKDLTPALSVLTGSWDLAPWRSTVPGTSTRPRTACRELRSR